MKKRLLKLLFAALFFTVYFIHNKRTVFYTPEATSQNVKIPSKNISLFFMGDAGGAVSAKVRPIKKIALSLPPQKTRRRNRNRLRAGRAGKPIRQGIRFRRF